MQESKLRSTKEKNWNVINDDDFKEIIEEVFELVSARIGATLGPYCGNTILEEAGHTVLTKDGWSVLKAISFTDPVYNAVLNLLKNVCAPVNLTVGDSSSTSVLTANFLYKRLKQTNLTDTYRPKDIIEVVKDVCEELVEIITQNSKKIDVNGNFDEIYQVALTSTNQNTEFSEIIREIYKQTGNPAIDHKESKDGKTTMEIVNGFKGEGTYLDRVYQNRDDGACVCSSPLVLTFDYKLDENDWRYIITPAMQQLVNLITTTQNQNLRLFVYAPYYSETFLREVRRYVESCTRANQYPAIIFCRAPIANADYNDNYRDFCNLLGCRTINSDEGEKFLPKYSKGEMIDNGDTFVLDEYIGKCEKITVAPDGTIIEGLFNMNTRQIEIERQDVEIRYKQEIGSCLSSSTLSPKVFALKKRLSRLGCKIGIINVGGRSAMEKRANMDAVDDAIRACESAFTYGYNIGGSLAIITSCDALLDKHQDDLLRRLVITDIRNASRDVYREVLVKYFHDRTDEMEEVIEKSIETGEIFNLVTKEFGTDVVNPTRADIEVLHAATAMCSLLFTSSQYVSVIPTEELFR